MEEDCRSGGLAAAGRLGRAGRPTTDGISSAPSLEGGAVGVRVGAALASGTGGLLAAGRGLTAGPASCTGAALVAGEGLLAAGLSWMDDVLAAGVVLMGGGLVAPLYSGWPFAIPLS